MVVVVAGWGGGCIGKVQSRGECNNYKLINCCPVVCPPLATVLGSAGWHLLVAATAGTHTRTHTHTDTHTHTHTHTHTQTQSHQVHLFFFYPPPPPAFLLPQDPICTCNCFLCEFLAAAVYRGQQFFFGVCACNVARSQQMSANSPFSAFS